MGIPVSGIGAGLPGAARLTPPTPLSMGVYAGPKGRERASRETIDSQRGVIP